MERHAGSGVAPELAAEPVARAGEETGEGDEVCGDGFGAVLGVDGEVEADGAGDGEDRAGATGGGADELGGTGGFFEEDEAPFADGGFGLACGFGEVPDRACVEGVAVEARVGVGGVGGDDVAGEVVVLETGEGRGDGGVSGDEREGGEQRGEETALQGGQRPQGIHDVGIMKTGGGRD